MYTDGLVNAHLSTKRENLQSRLDTYFNKDTHRTVLYFLVYDQDKEKQKGFKNVMINKPLAEKHKCS